MGSQTDKVKEGIEKAAETLQPATSKVADTIKDTAHHAGEKMKEAGQKVKDAAQVAGTTTLGVPATEITTLARGWSAKKQILGKPVYNDHNERVGDVDDIIVAPDKSLSYAILGVGGFLGLGEHYVAIPFNQFKSGDGKYVLAGATKDTLKAIPTFNYAK